MLGGPSSEGRAGQTHSEHRITRQALKADVTVAGRGCFILVGVLRLMPPDGAQARRGRPRGRAAARAGGPRAPGGLGAAGHGAGGLGSPACGLVQRESRPMTGLLPGAGALRAGGKEVRSARYCAALSSAPLRVDADRDPAREGSLVHGTLDLPA